MTSTSQPSTVFSPPTIHDIVQMCLRFSPKRAAETNDSSLCVTPLITQVILDGQVVDLTLVHGKWAAHYARVSDIKQRSQSDPLVGAEGDNRHKGDGNSEIEQVERGIRYYISRGQSFKIYSDASISGDFPNADPALIRRMLAKKARRYKQNFIAILLDPVSLQQYTPQERASLTAFLERRVVEIQRGSGEEDMVADAAATPGDERRRRGRPSQRAYYRQGFHQLWQDGKAGCVHTISIGEESRLCRDADLHILFLEVLQQQHIELHGLTHAVADLDITDPMNRAVTYLMASLHEARLREISQHTFRGKVQALKSGKPQGILPWYTRKGEDGKAILIPEYVEIARRAIHLSLTGLGTANIVNTLREEGRQVRGKWLTRNQIETLLTGEGILGVQTHFGLRWHTLPPLVDQATYEELHAGRRVRREQMDTQSGVHDEKRWTMHLLTHLAYCWCGRKLRRRYVYAYHQGKRTGVQHDYYDCPATQRAEPHVCLRAEVLEGFVEEIARHNPQALTGAFAAGQGGADGSRQVQRALLEARLQAEQKALAQQEEAARAEAHSRADKTGLPPTSTHYANVVEEIVGNLLQTPRAELQALRQALDGARVQVQEERQRARLTQSLQDLQAWDALDVHTRNRLLATVFARLTVYTLERGGYVEMRLVGLDTPLPPVPLGRGEYRTLTLPTVAAWLGSLFAL